MRIKRFIDYITEVSSPLNYIRQALSLVKKRLLTIFETDWSEFNMIDMKVSDLTKDHVNLIVRWEVEEDFNYELIISVFLNAISDDDEEPLEDADIEVAQIQDCEIKLKKYNQEFELVEQIDRTAKLDDINKEFIEDLTLDLENMETNQFAISTKGDEEETETEEAEGESETGDEDEEFDF